MRPTQEAPARLRRSPRKHVSILGDTDDDGPRTFQSPSQLPEQTDYELNYSESPGPPRRCSTIRKQTSNESRSAREERSDNDEESGNEYSSAAVASSSSKQKPVHIRKQLTPISLEQQRQRNFLFEVGKLQMRTDFLVPRLPFSRLIRSIMLDTSSNVNRITSTALEALQCSAEMFLEQRLHDAYLLTLHRGRVTLDVRDMVLINFLRHNSN